MLVAPETGKADALIDALASPAQAAAAVPGSDELASLERRVGHGVAWTAAGNVIMRLGNVAVMAVVARTLSQEDFGVFAVAATIYAIVASIAELGVASSVARADLDIGVVAPAAVTVSFVSSAVLGVGMFLLADPIALALGSAEGASPIRVMAAAVVMCGAFAVPAAQLQRELMQDRIFLSNMVGFAASNASLLVLALHGDGALSFAWSRVIGQACAGAVLMAMVSRRFAPGLQWAHLRFVLGFGLPLAGANLINFTLLNADYVLIGRWLGSAELGVYLLAFTVASWPSSVLSSVVNGMAIPVFSRAANDGPLLQATLNRTCAYLVLAAAPISALTAALARPLMATLYGEKWVTGATVLTLLTTYGGLSIFCVLIGNILSAVGRTRSLLLAQLPWLAALVPAMALGVQIDGIRGAAFAHIVVILAVAAPIYLALLKQSTGVRLRPIAIVVAWPLFAAALAGAAALGATQMLTSDVVQLVGGGLVGVAVYCALVGRRISSLRSAPVGQSTATSLVRS